MDEYVQTPLLKQVDILFRETITDLETRIFSAHVDSVSAACYEALLPLRAKLSPNPDNAIVKEPQHFQVLTAERVSWDSLAAAVNNKSRESSWKRDVERALRVHATPETCRRVKSLLGHADETYTLSLRAYARGLREDLINAMEALSTASVFATVTLESKRQLKIYETKSYLETLHQAIDTYLKSLANALGYSTEGDRWEWDLLGKGLSHHLGDTLGKELKGLRDQARELEAQFKRYSKRLDQWYLRVRSKASPASKSI